MGCDIHLVLEARKHDDSGWVGVHNFPYTSKEAIDLTVYSEDKLLLDERPHVIYPKDFFATWKVNQRNYLLFGYLAKVRREPETGLEPRGIPDDVSELTQYLVESWGIDGHSHTHMSVREFAECWLRASMERDQIDAVKKKVLGDDPITKIASDLFAIDSDYLDNRRVVIWFDN